MWLRKKDFEIMMEQIDEKLIPIKKEIEKLKHPPRFKYGDVVDIDSLTHPLWSHKETYKKVKIIGVSWVDGCMYKPTGWAYTVDTGSGCIKDVHENFLSK